MPAFARICTRIMLCRSWHHSAEPKGVTGMDQAKRGNRFSRREFLPTAAWLGGSLLRAAQTKAGAAADAERKSAVLSEEAISLINEIADRSVIPYYPSGKDDADNIALI